MAKGQRRKVVGVVCSAQHAVFNTAWGIGKLNRPQSLILRNRDLSCLFKRHALLIAVKLELVGCSNIPCEQGSGQHGE
jgi:hypothetical protein